MCEFRHTSVEKGGVIYWVGLAMVFTCDIPLMRCSVSDVHSLLYVIQSRCASMYSLCARTFSVRDHCLFQDARNIRPLGPNYDIETKEVSEMLPYVHGLEEPCFEPRTQIERFISLLTYIFAGLGRRAQPT